MICAGDIKTDQHTALAFSAGPHLDIITVAVWTNRICIQVIQVAVNDAGHIHAVAPHPLIMFNLHIDSYVLHVIRQGRASDPTHGAPGKWILLSGVVYLVSSPPHYQNIYILKPYDSAGSKWCLSSRNLLDTHPVGVFNTYYNTFRENAELPKTHKNRLTYILLSFYQL